MTTLPFCPIEGKRSSKHRRKVVAKRIEGVAPSKNGNTEADADNTPDPVINADADNTTVDVGREAWERIKTNGRKNWDDWKLIGQALVIGRKQALKKADRTEPGGKIYNQEFGQWLKSNGFHEIDSADRADLFKIMDTLDEIEEWRAGLTEEQQAKWNHPSTVWRVSRCKDRGLPRFRSVEPNSNGSNKGGNGSDTTELHDDDNEAQEEIEWQRSLLQRAHKAQGDARIELWALPKPPDPAIISVVRKVAKAWNELADYLESITDASPDQLAEARASYAKAQEAKKGHALKKAEAQAQKAAA